VAGSKRERELHRQKLARQQQEAARAAEIRRSRLRIGGIVAAVVLVVGVIGGIAIAGNDDTEPAAAPTAPTAPATTAPAASTAPGAKVTCVAPNDKKPGTKQYTEADFAKLTLIPGGVYTEAVDTNCGSMKLQLDAENAPNTTKAFIFLSDRQFYDNTSCHRLTTEGIYVLQCGDPLGNGTGGPGFKIAEENPPKAGENGQAIYKAGTVAMANAGPGTTGSQFFLVYKDSPLRPDYTVVGKIIDGIEVLDHVAAQGTADGSADGPPKQPLQITKMISSVTYEPSE
jgi:peptidyl-prolyl cis-trans isomerase B (cyclophilin B)